jgi:hypothetical protein
MDQSSIPCRGKLIQKIRIEDNKLYLKFDDCTLVIMDDQQSCCETRYMTCDDPYDYWEGAAFMGYDIVDAPNIQDDNDHVEHECQFLIVETLLGSFTVANHNEHNGYYGGFGVIHGVIFPDSPEIQWRDYEDRLR